jgi:hypothetical protein
VRATPTPVQKWALDTLGHLAPLLRLMRCEVLRVVNTVNEDRRASQTTFLAGPGVVPPGLRTLLDYATCQFVGGWLRDPDDEAAVDFDTLSGLVDVHRHGEGNYGNRTATYWVAGMALADPPRFAQPLGPLFTGTLEAGGQAVLADWFEEQSDEWAVLADLLRTWQPYTPNSHTYCRDFQYAHTSPDTACWQFTVWEVEREANGENGEWVIGLGVFGPDGLERAWHFASPKSLENECREQLWRLFPTPPGGDE